jgi:hypothetical protein
VTLSGVTATTVVAPARATRAVGPVSSRARTALVHYLRHNHPQAMLVHTGRAHAIKSVTATAASTGPATPTDLHAKQTFTKVGALDDAERDVYAEDQITSNWGLDGFGHELHHQCTVEQLARSAGASRHAHLLHLV